MGPRFVGRLRPRKSRLARFEQLEQRYYLSATTGSLAAYDGQTTGVSAALAAAAAPNQAITSDSAVQQMPSVAVNPLDSNHVAIAYMDYSLQTNRFAGIRVAMSRNGGDTWQYSNLPLPAGFEQGAANPIAKFDGDGHLFVVFMSVTFKGELPPITNPSGVDANGQQYRRLGFQSNNGIFVSRSEDGGATWGAAAAVEKNIYDNGTLEHNGSAQVPFVIIPDLAIDTFKTLPNGQANPRYGSLYVTYSRYYPAGQYPGEPNSVAGSNTMIAVSTDGGKVWQEKLEPNAEESPDPNQPILATVLYNKGMFRGTGNDLPVGGGLGFENWAHVDVGPEGDVYVALFAGSVFHVHHSTDGANSFDHPDPITRALYPFGANVPTFPVSTFEESNFRQQVVRQIATDPTRPGVVYVAEANPTTDIKGVIVDQGDVVLAASTNYGFRWQRTFGVGENSTANVVNDENLGSRATGADDNVAASQAMPRMVTDAAGNVALIWYDTRRDPENRLLDVFGSIGKRVMKEVNGQNVEVLEFGPNFRISSQSFDADLGAFTDARGGTSFYIGDFVGMDMSNNVMYAAWMDTRNGNQDIFFSRIDTSPLPAPPNDRFELNETAATATELGTIVERELPKLALSPGDVDWFRFETGATGKLSVAAVGDNVSVELYASDGTTRIWPPIGSQIAGSSFEVATDFGQNYLVRVAAAAGSAGGTAHYSLSLQALTADLGTKVFGAQTGNLADGDKLFYTLEAAAAGSLEVSLKPGANAQGTIRLRLLDPETQQELATANSTADGLHASLAVAKGQSVYIVVDGQPGTQGSFTLAFVNLDQFATRENNTTFVPTGIGPSELVLADLNGDGAQDMVVSHVGQNIVSIILNNGDGTFQAPREFTIGAFQQEGPYTLFGVPNFHRDLAVANFNPGEDTFPDILVVNTASGDVSLLLGNGDGTFRPQRRFDATGSPYAMAIGDVNNDGNIDFVVVDSNDESTALAAVRLGRRDGTFQAPLFFTLPGREENRTNSIRLADVNGDHILDLVERDFANGTSVMFGNGDGTFQTNVLPMQPTNGPGIEVTDLDGDGDLDIVTTHNNISFVQYTLNKGDGTFEQETVDTNAGQVNVAVAVADYGRAITLQDGSIVLGPPDGIVDLIVAANGRPLPTMTGPAEIILLAGQRDESGAFNGFADPIRLTAAKGPLDVKARDMNGDGVLDVVVVDVDGIQVIYGRRPEIEPNDTKDKARDLGTVLHLVQPTLTIVPEHNDAFFKFTVASEAFQRAGDQVIDFSGGFANLAGAGLMMEVLDSTGNVLGRGERFRLVAHQGDELFVHVFGMLDGQNASGVGAYTLVIDTLPQVAAVEAHTLLNGSTGRPGGPTTSFVLIMQGERLDPTTAEVPENYKVTWLGPNGIEGGGDDQVIPVGAGLPADSPAVIYDPSRNNVDVTSDGQKLVYPTAVRQTVTLLFGSALPAGNYKLEVSSAITSTPFNVDETDLLSPRAGFNGHPVVSISGPAAVEGSTLHVAVQPAGNIFDAATFEAGFPFLIAFHGNAGVLLDTLLSSEDDAAAATQRLIDLILASFAPGLLDADGRPITSLLVGVFDPLSFSVTDPDGRTFAYDLKADIDNAVTNDLRGTYVEVSSNVEVIVIVNPRDTYRLQVADVPARARGAAVYFGLTGRTIEMFTDAFRQNITSFDIVSPDPKVLPPSPTPPVSLATTANASSVFFAAPQFSSLFRSFVSAGNSFAPLLLVTSLDHSGEFSSGVYTADVGSGGSQNLTEALRSVLDEVFGQWTSLKQAFDENPLSNDGDEAETPFDVSPFGRAWQAVIEAVESWVAPNDKSASNEQSTPPQDGAKDNKPAGNESASGSSHDVEGDVNSNASDAPKRASSAQSDADLPQPSPADPNPPGEDQSHATAA